jgi:shikimate 5-dehydrogenase
VALALRREGARVAICARRSDQARVAANAVGAETIAWPASAGSWDVLVNATPVGSHAVPGRPYDAAFDGRILYDLVYDPDPTEIMRAAREAAVETIGGIEMLVEQAERQFEIWTGERPSAGLFAEAAADAARNRTEWSER